MSTLRTSNLIHGSSSIKNIVLDTQGRAIFGPNSAQGRASLYVNPQNNRVGINNESPAVALDVDGDINATGTVSFTGDLNIDNGTLFVDSSSNRVGINTATPSTTLDVNGLIGIREGSSLVWHDASGNVAAQIFGDASDNLVFRNTSSLTERMRIDSSGNLLVGADSSASSGSIVQIREDEFGRNLDLIRSYDTANTPSRLRFSNSRGTAASPTAVVNQDLIGEMRFHGYDGNDYNNYCAAIQAAIDGVPGNDNMPGRLTFSTTADGSASPIERLRITKDGNILVGIETPGSNYRVSTTSYTPKVQISGNDVYALSLKRSNSACYLSLASDRTPQNDVAVGSITFNQRMPVINDLANIATIGALTDGTPTSASMPGRLSFQVTATNATSPAEVMRITSNKRVGINNDTTGAAESLQVSPTQGNTDQYCISTSLASTGSSFHFRMINGNGVVGSIKTSGSSTSYNESSDYRLKENIISITDGIDRIKKLKPSRYNFITEPGITLDGFIAHEAQTVVPESVTGEKDETEEQEYEITPAVVNNEGEQINPAVMGVRTAPVMQGIDKSKLVPLLTAALQEAIAKIETLEQRLSDAGF
jgi:hypothetical protein